MLHVATSSAECSLVCGCWRRIATWAVAAMLALSVCVWSLPVATWQDWPAQSVTPHRHCLCEVVSQRAVVMRNSAGWQLRARAWQNWLCCCLWPHWKREYEGAAVDCCEWQFWQMV